MLEAFLHITHTLLNKLVRAFMHHAVRGKHFSIDRQHVVQYFMQFVLPWALFIHFGKQGIHTRFTAFFMLEQTIGHTGVSRNDKYALVQGFALRLVLVRTQPDIVQNILVLTHRRAADFFYRMQSHGVSFQAFRGSASNA